MCAVLGRLPLLSRVQSLTLATPCAPQVIARAIFELKYLVSFAIATIAVANHTRKVADEAHCRMQAANIAAAPSLLAVGQLFKVGAEKLYSGEDVGVSSPGSSNITNCLAEKAARLTYGWDLNDLEHVDVYFLVMIGLVVAIHFVAFVTVLHRAIKEKPVAGCHSNWEPEVYYPRLSADCDAFAPHSYTALRHRWMGLRATLPSASRSTRATTARQPGVRGSSPST